jgi:hypothetical protein
MITYSCNFSNMASKSFTACYTACFQRGEKENVALPCMHVAEDRCNHSNQLKVAGYSPKLSNTNAG